MERLRDLWELTIVQLPGGAAVTLGKILSVLALLLLGYLASRLAGFLLARRLSTSKLRPDAIYVLQRIAFFAILIVVVLTALALLGIPLTAFAFATGAIAIGVGFGAQNIINNFISGWILLAERPIRIDDVVEIDGSVGTIERIGTRSTRIRRTDGVHMLVPNSTLLEKIVVNWTLVDKEMRNKVRVGVAYGSPPQVVKRLILQAVSEHESVIENPPPVVVFDDFGDSALMFDAYFWSDGFTEKDMRVIRSDVRFRISELFEEHGIVIAFPQRDVHLDAGRPIPVTIVSPGDKNEP